MRVISGLFRGKRLIQPEDLITRPLKDLTKESIFNILTHSKKYSIDFSSSEILDLFAGVGSFGIECMSRGAKHVTFVEKYKPVLKILKNNISHLKSIKNYEIIEADILNDLFFESLKKKYNLIFIDPPFKERNTNFIIENIFKSKILKFNGTIVIHRHLKESLILPENFKVLEEKNYGKSKISFGKFS